VPAATVDVVIVSYRSGATLRRCVEPLLAMEEVGTTVVDNASPDDTLDAIAGLPVKLIRAPRNGGFSYGCNLGAAAGAAPYLLFLNPDATIDEPSLAALIAELEAHPEAGLVAPRVIEPGGVVAHSRRRFPRQRSTYAQALFLHRIWPEAAWTDELVRTPSAYETTGESDWVSGACMLVRRSVFEAIGGFDERFFLYCEDIDICKRIWEAGSTVRFAADSTVHHIGGASSETGETRAIAARSRVIYAQKHFAPRRAWLERLGIALGEFTHALAALHRPAARDGYVSALRAVVSAPR
jgi:GT2 family glycosyltransferase